MSKISLSTRPAPKCQFCGKPKGDHTGKTGRCPIGSKHRTLGYTQFHQHSFYVPKEKAR